MMTEDEFAELLNRRVMMCRTQFDKRLDPKFVDYPDSIVQAGMSPSISQMVRTRSVGGQIDEFEMDGIESDAPFDSEYVDFFDMADMADEAAAETTASKQDTQEPVERKTGKKSASDDGAPPKESFTDDSSSE